MDKYTALTKETLRRVLRLLLVSKLGEEKNDQLAKVIFFEFSLNFQHQILTKSFLKQLITDLADDLKVVDEVPEGELNSAEQIVKLVDVSQKGYIKLIIL